MERNQQEPSVVLKCDQSVEVFLWGDSSSSLAYGVIDEITNRGRPRSLVVVVHSNTPFAQPGDQLFFMEWVRKNGSKKERGYSLEKRIEIEGDASVKRASMRRLGDLAFQIGVWI